MNRICQNTNESKSNTPKLLKLKLARLITILSELMRRRKTRSSLANLPDYILKDIGLTRAEAYQEAAKPFWQK